MADPRFSDDEQVEKLKDWWRRNGLAIIIGGVIGIGGVVGWNGWTYWQESRAEAGSAMYERLLEHQRAGDPQAVRELARTLMDDYRRTPYGGHGALVLARTQVNAGELDAAVDTLEWAVGNARGETLVHAARLFLVRVLLERGDVDAAAARLDGVAPGGFDSEYAELRGDVALQSGRAGAAADYYREAIETLTPGSAYGSILRMKLNMAEMAGDHE
jgi:predicted negative regulator of RcsB-dependent stress response